MPLIPSRLRQWWTPLTPTERVGWITGGATILTAIIAGVFLVVTNRDDVPPRQPNQVTASREPVPPPPSMPMVTYLSNQEPVRGKVIAGLAYSRTRAYQDSVMLRSSCTVNKKSENYNAETESFSVTYRIPSSAKSLRGWIDLRRDSPNAVPAEVYVDDIIAIETTAVLEGPNKINVNVTNQAQLDLVVYKNCEDSPKKRQRDNIVIFGDFRFTY